MRARSVLAVLASAVAGVVCGVGAGYLLNPPGHASFADPLGLDVPLTNLGCTGQTLLVTAVGDSGSALAQAVAENPDHTRYLRTARSCDLAWADSPRIHPRYVAYVSYPSTAKACADRMTAAHRGDFVLKLHRGSTSPQQCLCYLDYQTMPTLRQGMVAHTRDGIYTRALQQLLMTMGLDQRGRLSGVYDARTAGQVRTAQRRFRLTPTGVVDPDTWHSLQTKGCQLYPS